MRNGNICLEKSMLKVKCTLCYAIMQCQVVRQSMEAVIVLCITAVLYNLCGMKHLLNFNGPDSRYVTSDNIELSTTSQRY